MVFCHSLQSYPSTNGFCFTLPCEHYLPLQLADSSFIYFLNLPGFTGFNKWLLSRLSRNLVWSSLFLCIPSLLQAPFRYLLLHIISIFEYLSLWPLLPKHICRSVHHHCQHGKAQMTAHLILNSCFLNGSSQPGFKLHFMWSFFLFFLSCCFLRKFKGF